MPALIAWLLAGLESRAGSLIISALLSLGISVASYKFAVDPLRNLIFSYLSDSGAQFTAILGFLGVDQAITMILSTLATRWSVNTGLHLIRKS